MMNKKQIQSLVGKIIFTRLRKKQYPIIHNLIANLKKQNRYQKYPATDNEPAITGMSIYHKPDLEWLDFYYSIYGKVDPNFISVPVYYYIETCLNHRMLTYAIKEKNFYNKFLPEIPTPKTFLRKINGIYYDDQFVHLERGKIYQHINQCQKVILKPTVESGGGNSILVFEKMNGVQSSDKQQLDVEFLDRYGKDFIVQEFVYQHNFFSQFNPTSNNTVRVFTYRSVNNDSVNILHCLLRVGAKGSYLDHDHLGGVVMAINDSNTLSEHAIDLYGNKFKSVNDIQLKTLGKVPAMEQIRTLAKQIAGDVFYGRLLAIDFTVNNENKALLLEINCWRNGISQYQMHNGGLFKEFTKEILAHCQTMTPHFVLTF
ncbi:MAG: sugar-transfer associated ATP-grasp domain-containing protein [Salinivirgaceae bacterium]|nr:sugar-transfer associated ATP-grasp domain-containing protein [Salinivirgaceae bacterium]